MNIPFMLARPLCQYSAYGGWRDWCLEFVAKSGMPEQGVEGRTREFAHVTFVLGMIRPATFCVFRLRRVQGRLGCDSVTPGAWYTCLSMLPVASGGVC